VIGNGGMAILVGIGEMVISDKPGDVLSAPNLGSCIGVSIYDPASKRGGMIHCMLPVSKSNPEKAAETPTTYVDTGVVMMLNQLLANGANKRSLVITVAGGSNINDSNNVFEIGKKNYTVFRKIMWKNGLLIKGEHIGDSVSRTVSLHLDTGEVWVRVNGEMVQLA
jgi:chemotaxis protein CheD